MVSSNPTMPLSAGELDFWEKAFLAAELPTLLKGEVGQINPVGAAHMAAEYANAAVIERRRVQGAAP